MCAFGVGGVGGGGGGGHSNRQKNRQLFWRFISLNQLRNKQTQIPRDPFGQRAYIHNIGQGELVKVR